MIDAYAATALQRLRLRWIVVAVLAGVATGLAYERLTIRVGPALARRWLVIAVPVLAYELGIFWRFLPRNRTDGSLSSALGPATLLTVARGVLVAFLAGFLLLPWPAAALAWLPATLYGLAALADALDGLLARLTDHVTDLGARLDAEIDALGILVASLLGVGYGQLPVWYLLAGAARYLFGLGAWYRRRASKPVYDLPPRSLRRVLAAVQMAFLAAALSPMVTPPATTGLAAAVLVPFLGQFLWDWWYLTGRLPW